MPAEFKSQGDMTMRDVDASEKTGTSEHTQIQNSNQSMKSWKWYSGWASGFVAAAGIAWYCIDSGIITVPMLTDPAETIVLPGPETNGE